MIYYGNELYHHGVSGQKWGTRRYQNLDGSYKSGAKGRYNQLVSKVKTRISNTVSNLKVQKSKTETETKSEKTSESNNSKTKDKSLSGSEIKKIAANTGMSQENTKNVQSAYNKMNTARKKAADIQEQMNSETDATKKAALKKEYDAAILDYNEALNNYNQVVSAAMKEVRSLSSEEKAVNIKAQEQKTSESDKTKEEKSETDKTKEEKTETDKTEEEEKTETETATAKERARAKVDKAKKRVKAAKHYCYYGEELYHHGVIGQKWGVRRYQDRDGHLTEEGRKKYLNPDGSLNKAGEKFKNKLDKKDNKWANDNYEKITSKAYKQSAKELKPYQKELKENPTSKRAMNEYNRQMAEIMNTKVTDLRSPSGKVIKFVAKRGELGVHMGLATSGYDMSQVKNGVWASGKIAYKSKSVGMI